MIVHLIGSIRNFNEDPSFIRTIIETVHQNGDVLAHNWLDAALTRKKEDIYISDWTPFVENDLNAIKRADIIIAELTHYAFSQGFQIAAALEYKKPVLAITRHSIKGRMASGISDSLFAHKTYNTTDGLQTAVREFLKKNTVHTKDLRFNILLTRSIFQYLETETKETGKNKSEIVRDIVVQKINSRKKSTDD